MRIYDHVVIAEVLASASDYKRQCGFNLVFETKVQKVIKTLPNKQYIDSYSLNYYLKPLKEYLCIDTLIWNVKAAQRELNEVPLYDDGVGDRIFEWHGVVP